MSPRFPSLRWHLKAALRDSCYWLGHPIVTTSCLRSSVTSVSSEKTAHFSHSLLTWSTLHNRAGSFHAKLIYYPNIHRHDDYCCLLTTRLYCAAFLLRISVQGPSSRSKLADKVSRGQKSLIIYISKTGYFFMWVHSNKNIHRARSSLTQTNFPLAVTVAALGLCTNMRIYCNLICAAVYLSKSSAISPKYSSAPSTPTSTSSPSELCWVTTASLRKYSSLDNMPNFYLDITFLYKCLLSKKWLLYEIKLSMAAR